MLPIYDLTPFTMLDFPKHTAAIIWFAGCNMRCRYCHNPQIVKGKSGRKGAKEIIDFLKKRQGLLDGVVLSGGEATLYEGIIEFAKTIKKMGFAIKLDTNGSRPKIIKKMLDDKLLDFIALDYKAPPSLAKIVTGVNLHSPFEKTLEMLCKQNNIPFEVRTTIHTKLMDEEKILEITNDLKQKGYKGTYHIQNYINNGSPTLGNLPKQEKEVNISKLLIAETSNFQIAGRNFSNF